MTTIRLPVHIHSQDGKSGDQAVLEVARPSLLRRLGTAAVMVLLGAGVGTLLLPIPLIHLFGLAFFVGMCVFAVRELLAREVLKGARGQCPSCLAEGSFYVGFGRRGLRYPVTTSCPACTVGLELTRAGPEASGQP